jgi:AcrR family transcriptional regulator
MARPRTIDRNLILTAAEDLLSGTGGTYFTLDQVAARAGVSKGAITNAYASKAALVDAMLVREFDRFRASREVWIKPDSPYPLVEAHIAASENVNDTYKARAARLIAALAHEQSHIDTIRGLYMQLIEDLSGDSQAARQGRLALFAIEGAFLMRGLGMVDLSDKEWSQLFEDALAVFKPR